MRLAILALTSVACADAAFAQIQIGRGKFEPMQQPSAPQTQQPPDVDSPLGFRFVPRYQPTPAACMSAGPPLAKKQFVENIHAGQASLRAQDGAATLAAVERARPHAMGGQQLAALGQLEIAALYQVGDDATLIAALERGVADECHPDLARKNYQEILIKLRNGGGRD